MSDAPTDRPRAPWRLLFLALGIASAPGSIVLAALGTAALRAGLALIASFFDPAPWLSGSAQRFNLGLGSAPDFLLGGVGGAVLGLLSPFLAAFQPGLERSDRLGAVLASIWVLLVVGLFGGAIARVAVVRFARGGRVGLRSALGFSLRRIGSLLAAPAAPILFAVGLGLVGAAVGLLDRLPGTAGVAAATVLAFVPLLIGLLDAVVLLGLALAWPLMVLTIVAEGEDFFDAVSRSYSYVNQRFVHYLGYLAVAATIGTLGLLGVGLFATVALALADWSVGIGAPEGIGFRFLDPTSADRSGLPALAHVWSGAIEVVAAGWVFSYLWSSAAILYLLLRREVDGAEIEDIFDPAEAAEPFLPDLAPTEPPATAD